MLKRLFGWYSKSKNNSPSPISSIKFKIVPEDNYSIVLLLFLFAVIMAFIRIFPLYKFVFTNWPGDYGNFVQFAADDAVYHMRLVHNMIHHFPQRMFFDPFTHFPFGANPHFGPLFTLIIAGSALLVGKGHPSPELVNIVAAYIPVLLGVLCLIPVYCMARRLMGKAAAILSAFIFTFLPGIFLQRSVLGFVDHHVAEVLFAAVTCTLLLKTIQILFVKRSQEACEYQEHIWVSSKYYLYSFLTGLAFGLYLLIWPAALMFGIIFLVFFITLLVTKHLQQEDNHQLLVLVLIVYGVAATLVLPYAIVNPHFEYATYSLFHPTMLLVMVGIFGICYLLHLLCRRNRYTHASYFVVLIGFFLVAILLLRQVSPKLYAFIIDGCRLLFVPTPEMQTIGEVKSSLLVDDKFTLKTVWNIYYWALPFALLGLLYLGYRVYKYMYATERLFFIWSIAMILAAIAQVRFNYYLAVNMAILAGGYCIYPILDSLSCIVLSNKWLIRVQKILLYLYFVSFAFLIVSPMLVILIENTIPKSGVTRQWYDSLMWLKKHTPDPHGNKDHAEFNYIAGCNSVPQYLSKPYNYPASAYGIMAFWDIGHQITYIAERIPNSNPFQQGVVEYNKTAGASLFFTSRDEKQAMHNLDLMGSRYIIVERGNVRSIKAMGIWCNDTDGWTEPWLSNIALSPNEKPLSLPVNSKKFQESMVSRLYYEDANGLQHIRLVHEANGSYYVTLKRVILKPHLDINSFTVATNEYQTAKKVADKANAKYWSDRDKNVFIYAASIPAKGVKIFEKVTGATIWGKVPSNIKNGTVLQITLRLKSEYGRVFYYSQTARVQRGTYKFTVPYPTTKMQGDGYSYDIMPLGKYQIWIGDIKKHFKSSRVPFATISVMEEDVMLGRAIKVNT